MKIEIGNYRTRDGRKAIITDKRFYDSYSYPFIGTVEGVTETWTRSGKYDNNDWRNSSYDLVAPWEEEFKPKRGDKVYIPEIDETRIFLAEIEGARNPIITVSKSSEEAFIEGESFVYIVYKKMEPIKVEENLVHLTFEDISNGKGKGVPSHLIRIKE